MLQERDKSQATLERWGFRDELFHDAKFVRLTEILSSLGSVAIAYSGGVDSTFLLRVATSVLGEKAIAVLAFSESLDRNEFEAAKERQALVEGKINDLHHKLSQCEVVEVGAVSTDRIIFGTTVDLEDLDTGEEVSYRLVGPFEADLAKGTISVTSPIGSALIGKEPGDNVKVRTPGGTKNLEIIDVHYATES